MQGNRLAAEAGGAELSQRPNRVKMAVRVMSPKAAARRA
jgi:hypothetical protein